MLQRTKLLENPAPMNIIMLAAVLIVGSAWAAYIWHRARSYARDEIKDEAEDAIEILMPDALGND